MQYRVLPVFILLAVLPLVPARAQEVLTLEEALEEARQNNYALQQARNNAAIAENDASLSNAGFLPSLSVNADRNQSLTNTNQQFIGDEDPERIRGAESTQLGAGANLSWTVFDGMGRWAALQRLDAERSGTQHATEETIDVVLSQVIVGYYSVVRQQQQLRVLEEAVALSEERLDIAELRLDLGSAAELEVRQARVDLNADRAELLRQEVELSDAKEELGRLMAREGGAEFSVSDTIVLGDGMALERLQAQARERNPLLEQLRQDQRAAEFERQEVRAERLPTVGLNLGYDYMNLSSESGFQQAAQSHAFSYGFSVSLDLFDGLNRRRRAQNAAIRINNAELAVRDVEAELDATLRSEYTSFENRHELVALEEENVEAARQNVDVALERFRLGTISSIELREVQESLTQAESRLLTALFEAKVAETELRRLAGDLPSN